MYSKILARNLCRSLRGGLPQSHLSQRLGQKFNLVHRWESPGRPIRWTEFLSLAEACGRPPERALSGLGLPPDTLLESLCRPHPQLRFSRFQLSRWRRGQVDPALHQVLDIIEITTPRLVPFVEGFVPLGLIPTLIPRGEARAQWAPEDPRLNRVAEAIRHPAYLRSSHHALATRLGWEGPLLEGALLALEKFGRVRWDGHHYRPRDLGGHAPLVLACSPEGLKMAQQALPTAFAQLKTLIHGAPGSKTRLAELQLAIREINLEGEEPPKT